MPSGTEAVARVRGGTKAMEQLAMEESRRIVSSHTAVFDRPPRRTPSFKTVDGPITGNGDIGLTVSGPPENQRYWISKNDFWKSGPDFHQCGPSLIGGIDVRTSGLEGASYRARQELYEPVISSEFSLGDSTVTMAARVAANDNVIILEIEAGGKPFRVDLELWAEDGYGSETAAGREEGVRWVARRFNEQDLLYPTGAVVAMRCLESGAVSFTLEPGKPVTIVASVVTNHESETYEEDARKKAGGLDRTGVDRLIAEHNEWWRKFWARSYVEVEDKLLEQHYYGSLYIMACCSRNVDFPPGLYGNWITKNRTAWAGDIHLNYNFEAPYWALYSSNRIELTDPYDTPLLEHLPIFRENARKYLGKRGAYASVGIGPKGLTSRFFDEEGMRKAHGDPPEGESYDDIAGQPMFLGQKCNAVFATMNMILRYRYTHDRVYARKVYPFLSAVAEFWEDYLRFENGRYVIHDDSFGEVGPWQRGRWRDGYGDFNSILSLGLLRVFFNAIIEMSEALDLDGERRPAWQLILDHLSDLPVVEDKGRMRFRACEGGDGGAKNRIGLCWIMMHALVYPATNIGLGSDPKQLRMILDDMSEWPDSTWVDHGNAFQTLFIGAARVGYDPEFLLSRARRKIEKYAYPNLLISTEGGGVETCSGVPGMINEMMLQSHSDLIRVFPVFPADQEASFYRLRTSGAFLISSAIRNGQVRYVVIESEKGRDCRLLNPWPDGPVAVHRAGREAAVVDNEVLVLETQPAERLVLAPEGVDVREVM